MSQQLVDCTSFFPILMYKYKTEVSSIKVVSYEKILKNEKSIISVYTSIYESSKVNSRTLFVPLNVQVPGKSSLRESFW